MKGLKMGHGTITLKEGDIIEQDTEAIVNAANSGLMGGGGVDGAIHAAGGPKILEECKRIIVKIGRLASGHAVITTAGRMPSKYVIHTVGPVWHGGKAGEAATLASCYRESLRLAKEKHIRTVSFPSISTGAYGYPIDEAATVALGAVRSFLEGNEGIDEVVFVLWGKEAYEAYERALDGSTRTKSKR
jgi:O-acetyl-ADP-ribose deacetylase (regulator of RNase III)